MKLWRLAIQIIPKTWSLKFLNKLIKNFVNTHREKDVAKPIKVKKDEVATKGNKDNSIRKASNSKEKKADGKRPKSSVDLNNINKNSTSQIIKNAKNYSSPSSNLPEYNNPNAKVKIYKIEKDQIIESKNNEKASKHLKSKSQVNNVLPSSGESRAKQTKTVNTKKYDFYNQNFSSTDYWKFKKNQDPNTIYVSPVKSQDKSPAKAISNFHQQKKNFKKSGQTINSSKQGNTFQAKYEVSFDFLSILKYLRNY